MKEPRFRSTRRRLTPERKTQLLEAVARHPAGVADFARRQGLATSTLFRWRRQAQPAARSTRQPTRGSQVGFQRVALAPLLGTGSAWAGEVQLPDGTQVRWASTPAPGVLLEVLACLRRPC